MIPSAAVPLEDTTLPAHTFWPREVVLWLLPLILVVQIAIWSVFLPRGGLRGIADFRQLYTGGYMLRTGHAKELCNYDAQKRFEDALVPVDIDFMLPINHLPFEELLFVPLSRFSYQTAYWLFLTFNCALLAVCIRLLKSNTRILSKRWRWYPALLFAAFYPISRAAVQGQDSIILLTLLAGALWSLDHDRDLTAGLLIGMGIFKFQIVIPIALLFLIWRRWRVCAGFAVSGATGALISLWLVGLHGAREYADTLLGMSVRLSSRSDMLHYGTIPMSMLNLRGLATALLSGTLSRAGLLLVIIASSVAVLVAAARQRPSLQLAIMASSLVSFHFLSHDASILIIPLAAALCSWSVWRGTAAVLLLVVSFAAVMPQYGYLGAIPLLALFIFYVTSPEESMACPRPAS
jgi:Glycosyltransferase family 87